jgi:uncharacterized coiled-coil protein SlyX
MSDGEQHEAILEAIEVSPAELVNFKTQWGRKGSKDHFAKLRAEFPYHTVEEPVAIGQTRTGVTRMTKCLEDAVNNEKNQLAATTSAEHMVQHKREIIKKKVEEINDLKKKLAEKEKVIQEKDKIIDEKENTIASLRAKLDATKKRAMEGVACAFSSPPKKKKDEDEKNSDNIPEPFEYPEAAEDEGKKDAKDQKKKEEDKEKTDNEASYWMAYKFDDFDTEVQVLGDPVEESQLPPSNLLPEDVEDEDICDATEPVSFAATRRGKKKL